jgi:hypothetical protein
MTLNTLLPDVFQKILLLFSAEEVFSFATVSRQVRKVIGDLEAQPWYWMHRFRGRVCKFEPEQQAFWLSVLAAPIALPDPVYAWKRLYYLNPEYVTGELLPTDLVFSYIDLCIPPDDWGCLPMDDLAQGMIYADRIPLINEWIQKYYSKGMTKSEARSFFSDVLKSGGGWNLLTHNLRDRLSDSRITEDDIEDMVIDAARSPDIGHYMLVASTTGWGRMFPELMKTILSCNLNSLGYYLTHVPGSRKVFRLELTELRSQYWTYSNSRLDNKDYLRFLSTVVTHSTDIELKQMISSPLDWEEGSHFSILLSILCQNPRVTPNLFNQSIVSRLPSLSAQSLLEILQDSRIDIPVYMLVSLIPTYSREASDLLIPILSRKRAPRTIWPRWMEAVNLIYGVKTKNMSQLSGSTTDFTSDEVSMISYYLLGRVVGVTSNASVHRYFSAKLLGTKVASSSDSREVKELLGESNARKLSGWQLHRRKQDSTRSGRY